MLFSVVKSSGLVDSYTGKVKLLIICAVKLSSFKRAMGHIIYSSFKRVMGNIMGNKIILYKASERFLPRRSVTLEKVQL